MALAVFKKGNEEALDRFIREARLTAQFNHPSIIPVYSWALNNHEVPYFLMKLIDGPNLTEFCKDVQDLRDLIQSSVIKICGAIEYAHNEGVIHLDIKPDNICLDSYGDPYVLDWGIAGIVNEELLDIIEKKHCSFRDDWKSRRRLARRRARHPPFGGRRRRVRRRSASSRSRASPGSGPPKTAAESAGLGPALGPALSGAVY